MGIPKAVLACVLGTLAIGTTGCGFPVITLNNVRDANMPLADPTAIVKDGVTYTYGTQIPAYGLRIPVSAGGSTSEALTKFPAWANGAFGGYLAAPDVVQIGNEYLMYFTATPSSSNTLNRNNCIGIAVSNGDMRRFTPLDGALLCGEVWDPYVTVMDGQTIMLYSTMEGSNKVIRSVRLTGDGRNIASGATTLLNGGSVTIENPTLIFEASTDQFVLLYSSGDWATINYETRMAYCGRALTASCSVQGPRGSFPFNNIQQLGMWGTGGMDLFDSGSGVKAVFHYWKSGDASRRTGIADVALTTQQNP